MNDICKMLTRSQEEPGANAAQSDMSIGLCNWTEQSPMSDLENLNLSLYPPSVHEGKQKHASSFAHYSSQFEYQHMLLQLQYANQTCCSTLWPTIHRPAEDVTATELPREWRDDLTAG